MYEADFWTSSRLSELWDIVGVLLKFVAPGLMIVVAIIGVGMLLKYIIDAFKQGADDERRNQDEEDYEVKYYD